ncbi:MAG: hypothetical protein ACT4QC_05770 [Planctomycetaceae bacterium]
MIAWRALRGFIERPWRQQMQFAQNSLFRWLLWLSLAGMVLSAPVRAADGAADVALSSGLGAASATATSRRPTSLNAFVRPPCGV